jgi:hypothetical protein
MAPKEGANLLRENQVKLLGAAIGKHTTVQIERPHIIDGLPANPTTEDEEPGTDHGCGWAVTNIGAGTVNHNAGPLSRCWCAKL